MSREQISWTTIGDRADGYGPKAPLAQSAEHFHGKEKVVGSIPTGGSQT